MSALAKPNFFSASAINLHTIVNAELVKDIESITVSDPNNSTNDRFEIHFHYVQPYTDVIKWRYTTAALRNTAFTAIKAAIATSST